MLLLLIALLMLMAGAATDTDGVHVTATVFIVVVVVFFYLFIFFFVLGYCCCCMPLMPLMWSMRYALTFLLPHLTLPTTTVCVTRSKIIITHPKRKTITTLTNLKVAK